MSLTMIDVSNQDLVHQSNLGWQAIMQANNPPYLFRYGRMLCRIEHDEKGSCTLQQLTHERLRYELVTLPPKTSPS